MYLDNTNLKTNGYTEVGKNMKRSNEFISSFHIKAWPQIPYFIHLYTNGMGCDRMYTWKSIVKHADTYMESIHDIGVSKILVTDKAFEARHVVLLQN